jgi:hypothetical protein
VTRATNARAAGAAFLIYIAAGITSMVMFSRASSGSSMAERLATLATHAADVGILSLLGQVMAICAIVLGVSLYRLTRQEDPDLAMIGLACRVGEGVIGAAVPTTLLLFWLATAEGVPRDAESTSTLASFTLRTATLGTLGTATFFAVGSTAFSWLLLRGRLIPAPLAWLGLVASVILVIGLPLQLAGFLRGMVTQLMWLPMLVFEIPFGIWLIVKGVAGPAGRTP